MKDFIKSAVVDLRAKGTIEVLDYEELALVEIVVGGDTLTEGTDFDAEESNEVTAQNIADAINALVDGDVTATGVDGAVVSVAQLLTGELVEIV